MLARITNRIFPSEANALRPRLACEITSVGVVAGRPGGVAKEIVSGFAPLRPGVLTAGLKPPNFTDRAAVANALRQALNEVKIKESQITVVIPRRRRARAFVGLRYPAGKTRGVAPHPSLSPAQAGAI